MTEQDPSNRLANKTWAFYAEPRFPDLTRKPIWKNKVIVGANADSGHIGESASVVDAAAIGESGSERRVRSIDLAMALASDRPPPEFLREFIDQLKRTHEGQIMVLTASDEDGWTVPVHLIYNEDGEINSRIFMDASMIQNRLRSSCVFDIKLRNERVYVVLIEAKPLYINCYLTSTQKEIDVRDILRNAVVDFLTPRLLHDALNY